MLFMSLVENVENGHELKLSEILLTAHLPYFMCEWTVHCKYTNGRMITLFYKNTDMYVNFNSSCTCSCIYPGKESTQGPRGSS